MIYFPIGKKTAERRLLFMKKHVQSISYKLLSTLVIATTLPLMVYCLFISFNMRQTAEKNYIEQATNTWQIIAANIDHSLSTSIDTANKGIYLNRTIQDLLFSRDNTTFFYAESANSSLIFSYLTNISSMTPEATQIQFSSFKTANSFLITTRNLQRYLRVLTPQECEFTSPVPTFQAYILPPHAQDNYGHRLDHTTPPQNATPSQPSGTDSLVFTVCLPIYHMPSPNVPIGCLRIDISTDFFEKLCDFFYNPSEQFYIVDSDGHIIFSSDSTCIGSQTSEDWIWTLIRQAEETPDSFISAGSDDFLRICQKLPGDYCEWYMIKSVPKHLIYQSSNAQLAILLITFGICLLITVLINSFSILRFTTPLKKATIYLNSINTQAQNLNSRLSEYVTYNYEDEIGILFRSLEEMIDTINNFVIRQYELELVNRSTELKMLEAQINPHFIYNTLQCLATKSLEHHDREQYDYISSFGQLLQYSTDTSRTLVTVNDELSYIERYIELQKMRFTSRLSVLFEADESVRQIIVPKMLLQPLIENSFKHGNLFKKEHGSLCVRVLTDEDLFLHLYVIDNGRAPSDERLADINRRLSELRKECIHRLLTPHRLSSIDDNREAQPTPPQNEPDIKNATENLYATSNIGLSNVLLRMLLNFGSDCSMELYSNELGGTTVHLVLSYKNRRKEELP